MSTRKDANPRLAVYLDNLTIQLRLLEVPGDRIGQILAEGETHVADTGLDPVAAFGEPGEYAAMYEGADAACASASRERGWLRNMGVAMVSGMAGAAAVEGVAHLAGSAEVAIRTFGEWLAVGVVGMAVFHVFGAQLARDTAGSVKPLRFTSRFMVLGGLAYLAGVVVLVLIPLLPAGPTLAFLPGGV